MREKKKNRAYIVWIGRQTGVFTNWQHVNSLVEGYPKARYKGFETEREAKMVWNLGFDEYERGRLGKPVEKRGKLYPAKKVDPAISERAKAIVSKHTDPVTKSGQHTFTCTAASCTYPACQCE